MTQPLSPVAFQWIEDKHSATAYKVLIAFGFALATAIGAQIQIRLGFTPVPITLQTLFVFSSGLFLGANFGLLSQAMYLAMGLALPVYSQGKHGPEALFGATGGYLLGFLLFSYLSGRLFYGRLQRERSWIGQGLQLYLLSLLTIFVPGVTVLKMVTGASWAQAIAMGYVPFIVGDIIKIGAGLGAARWLLRKRGSQRA
ncbi:MAG TPA: biotin transporter BioY [Bdellovibrionales bacterium]|nr:biotin transporter BioY [Bdellovibrionales bacterium]